MRLAPVCGQLFGAGEFEHNVLLKRSRQIFYLTHKHPSLFLYGNLWALVGTISTDYAFSSRIIFFKRLIIKSYFDKAWKRNPPNLALVARAAET